MLSYLNARVLDLGLNVLVAEADRLDICSAAPADFAAATGPLSLGSQSGLKVGAIADAQPTGRRVTVPAITAGKVTGSGTAAHWAVTGGGRLLAAGALGGTQVVTAGNDFVLGEIDIKLSVLGV